MKRYGKSLAVACALVAALFLTITRGGSNGGIGVSTQMTSRAAPPRMAKQYDLSALKIFGVVLARVTDSYVDPKRIKPRQMLLSALGAVEKQVAEVLIDESPDKSSVTVRVQDVKRTFRIQGVDSPWALSAVIKKVLRFIQPHLQAGTKIQDVEYAAVNGMLSTLDPHSVLLSPEIYNEMKLSTRGHFGGLGIVISMINGVLTVMNPIKGTPAYEAGVKACDKILKIGEESTVNMTLSQAVKRLRGMPGSTVDVTILRAGWAKPVRKTLTRAVIKVDSVSSRMLSQKKIGYIRLKSFQGNSHSDIKKHLAKLKSKGMRGLILDLRGNPGGLLDQAIKISDLFIDSGTLLTTVSHAGKRREEKRAHREGTEARYPIAVLVNSGSASASEIVSGALKNLDRGVIIGKRTFGKGSVQVLYDNDQDGSALKLTIAQYLTPGDVSIQSVGISPDIATEAIVLRPEYIRLRHADDAPREKDLRKHLTHQNVSHISKSAHAIRYYADVSDGADKKKKKPQNKNLCLYPDRSCKPPKGDAFVEDFQIKLARDLLAEAKTWRRSQILASSGPLLKRVRAEQQKRVADAMKKLGLDWSKANGATGEPRLAVKVSTDPTGPARACKLMRLKVTVKNVGTAPTARLRAVTGSSNGLFDKHELVFGRIEPGATRSWEVPIKIRDAPTRTDDVVIKFHGAGKAKHQPFRFQMSVKGVERPVYSYSYQLIDDIKGNLDGQAQRGEEVRLFMRVRNKGKGPAFRTVAQLKDLSGPGIFIRKGRFNLGRLNPGQEKTASFTLWVKPNYSQKNFKLELTVLEDGLREYVSEKLVFPVAEDAQTVSAAKGTVKVSGGHAALRAWANKKAPLVGIAKRGASFKLLGKIGKWYRVMAPQSQIAFVSAKKMATVSGTARPKMIPKWQVSPPKITLQIPSHVTKKSTFKLKGIATDETQISDVYIFVRNREAKIDGRKIFYRSNRKSRTPRRLSFEVDVPLWEGANYITVFARESEDTRAQQTVVISRRKTNRVARKIDKRQP